MFDRFCQVAPVSVLGMISVRWCFSDAIIDEIFEAERDSQYTRDLTFSACVELLAEVALYGTPSVNAAIKNVTDSLPVSTSAIYQKLRNVEPQVCEALISVPAARAARLIKGFKATRAQPISKYRLKIVDGNYLQRSERRIAELRDSTIAAIPGMAMVVYDYATDLITHAALDENGHASESSKFKELPKFLSKDDLLMGDRRYCSLKLFEIVESCEAKFLIRKTKNLVLTFDEVKKCKGQCKTGQVEYGSATLSDGRKVFAIIIKRKKPAKDGTKEVILLTNLTIGSRLAVKLADLYLERWKIEEAFRQLTEYLSCEVKTLGYPRAALLAFSLAVTAYNCMRCVKGAMAFRFGTEHVDENLSMYHLGLHLKQTIPGALIALDESDWCMVDQMSPTEVVIKMKEIAGNICFDKFRKDRRSKPKTPRQPARRRQHVHAATAKILADRKKKS